MGRGQILFWPFSPPLGFLPGWFTDVELFFRGLCTVDAWIGIQDLVSGGVIVGLPQERLHLSSRAGQLSRFCFTQQCSGELEGVFGELGSFVLPILPLLPSAFCSSESTEALPELTRQILNALPFISRCSFELLGESLDFSPQVMNFPFSSSWLVCSLDVDFLLLNSKTLPCQVVGYYCESIDFLLSRPC